MDYGTDEALLHIMALRISMNLSTSVDESKLICTSIKAENYYFIKNEFSEICGYILWAKINIESLYQIFHFNKLLAYPFEWVEGDIIMITDITSCERVTIKQIRKFCGLVENGKTIFYFRKGKVFYYSSNNNFVVAPEKEIENWFSKGSEA
jgi:hypothetical protein